MECEGLFVCRPPLATIVPNSELAEACLNGPTSTLPSARSERELFQEHGLPQGCKISPVGEPTVTLAPLPNAPGDYQSWVERYDTLSLHHSVAVFSVVTR